MTVALDSSPTLISGCPKRWCLASNGCANEDPGNLRYHEGRTSSVWADGKATTLDVTPLQFDEDDGATYSGPMVTIGLDGEDTTGVDLGSVQAIEFSNTLAAMAGGDAAVGSEATFAGRRDDGTVMAQTVIVRRLPDFTFEYGSGRSRTGAFTQVEFRFLNDDFTPGEARAIAHGPHAAMFARYVAVAAIEVAA